MSCVGLRDGLAALGERKERPMKPVIRYPKSTAPTAQLQAKPCHSNSPGEGAVCFPPGAIRNQTKDHKL